MLQLRDEPLTNSSKTGSTSIFVWFYFTAEFWIGGLLSALFAFLTVLKSFLPKPPRDLRGDVVLITGANSTLGRSLAKEFAKSGCSVICVDKDLEEITETTSRLEALYPRIEEIKPRHRKDAPRTRPRAIPYECDLHNHEDIRRLARNIKDEVGSIDVLVTCAGSSSNDVFDIANGTLMSHYWTVLAFLPTLLHGEHTYVVGITPVASREDGYLGSRAAIAGLMDGLGQELSNYSSRITFLSLSPVASSGSSIEENEEKLTRDVVEAVKTDHRGLLSNCFSRALYRLSGVLYKGITIVTQWVDGQNRDYT